MWCTLIGAIRWFIVINSTARSKTVLRQAESVRVISVKASDICCDRFRDCTVKWQTASFQTWKLYMGSLLANGYASDTDK